MKYKFHSKALELKNSCIVLITGTNWKCWSRGLQSSEWSGGTTRVHQPVTQKPTTASSKLYSNFNLVPNNVKCRMVNTNKAINGTLRGGCCTPSVLCILHSEKDQIPEKNIRHYEYIENVIRKNSGAKGSGVWGRQRGGVSLNKKWWQVPEPQRATPPDLVQIGRQSKWTCMRADGRTDDP